MKILIDMNLPPQWRPVLEGEGWEAAHWSTIGDSGASDREIMDRAADQGYVVFTHDLDFGAMLAATGASAPSVIQVRAQDVFPDRLASLVVNVLHEQHEALLNGALLTIEPERARLRILPLHGKT